MKTLIKYSDDILLVLGCALILTGLAQWNAVITWITAGGMLIVFAFLIGKAKARDAAAKPVDE